MSYSSCSTSGYKNSLQNVLRHSFSIFLFRCDIHFILLSFEDFSPLRAIKIAWAIRENPDLSAANHNASFHRK